MYTIGDTLYGGSEFGLGNPFTFRQSVVKPPLALPVSQAPPPTLTAAAGGNMYYNNGFLPAGAGQTAIGGGGLLGTITQGINTFLPIIRDAFGGTQGTGITVRPTTPSTFPSQARDGGVVATVGKAIGGVASRHPVLTAAGGAGAIGGAVLATRAGRRAFHIGAGGKMVRSRRMNVANVKALRRAIRRAHGFEKVCKRVMHFVSPGRHPRGFKRARRRK